MLPEVTLRDVSRDDVDRIAWWLEDDEISSKWFGHYGCGDPVHRGYDPQHMLEASELEWERVFGDGHRLISSIYSDRGEHIGECEVILNGEGGAELSLLIGRKDVWGHGYGMATVLTLLDKAFGTLGVDRAWVNVPEDNTPAMGLFEKLGFVRKATREILRRPDGSPFIVSILTIDAAAYLSRQPRTDRQEQSVPVVTITGLPGSGSVALGEDVARMLRCRFVDSEITDLLCQRLACTPAELEAFEGSYRSFWTRLLSAIIVPMEWSATYDAGYHGFIPEQMVDFGAALEEQITKKQYVERLSRVVRRFAAEGNVVLHSHGSHLFLPPSVGALNVFVSSSIESRQRRIAAEQGLSLEEALRWLKRSDRDTLSIFRHLFDSDLIDMALFDLTVNVGRLPAKAVAEIVLGALKTAAPSIMPAIDTRVTQTGTPA